MKKVSAGQRYLLAEFLANIGVAWFAAGVIGVFLGGAKSLFETVFSIAWGLLLSLLFVLSGFYLLKGVKQ